MLSLLLLTDKNKTPVKLCAHKQNNRRYLALFLEIWIAQDGGQMSSDKSFQLFIAFQFL